MVQKNVITKIVAAISIVGLVTSLYIGCDDSPTESNEVTIDGTWFGMITKQGSGYLVDSFDIHLVINEPKFSMMRSSLVHGSSLGVPDSVYGAGSVTRIGTDSVVFTANPDSCADYDSGLEEWIYGASVAHVFHPEGFVGFKIAIEGDTWTVNVPRTLDAYFLDEIVMQKQ